MEVDDPAKVEEAGVVVEEEEPQGRLIEVDEEVKIHIDGLEYQLKQNEQTIQLLHQKNQEVCIMYLNYISVLFCLG